MKHKIADKLETTVQNVYPVLQAMSDDQAGKPLRPGGWSSKELLGHLIDSASNNHQRFVRLQQFTDLRLDGYDQELWVRLQGYAEAEWQALVTLWAFYNRHLAHVIRRITPETLANRCEIAPGNVLTLGYFVEDYLGHLEHHLRQMGVSNEMTVPYPLPGPAGPKA